MRTLKQFMILVSITFLSVWATIGRGETFYMPMGEQAMVDGDLSEWAGATWIPMNQDFWSTTSYTPDVSNAQWTARWCPATNSFFVAVTGTDTDPVRAAAYVDWDQHDSIEVYVDAGNNNYNPYNELYYALAQQYVMGVTPTDSVWVVMGGGTTIPSGDVPDVAGNYTGTVYTYEMELMPYNPYGGLSGGVYSTVYETLQSGKTVGLDVVLDSRTTAGEFGMFCNNLYEQKFMYASNFQDHQLVTALGGTLNLVDVDAGYHNGWTTAFDASVSHAQSFSPQQPYLVALETYHTPNSNVTGNFTLNLYACDPNSGTADPRTSPVLASVTRTSLQTGAEPDCWIRWEFDEPVDVSAYVGSYLVAVFTADVAAPAPACNYLGNAADYGYLDGIHYLVNGSTWTKDTGVDLAFRSYGLTDGEAYNNVVIDQFQETVTNGWPLDPNRFIMQSFSPALPYLYAVEVHFELSNYGGPGEYALELWRINPSLASGVDPRQGTEPIASAQINHLDNGWTRWDFAPPIDISSYIDMDAPLGFMIKSPMLMYFPLLSVVDYYSGGLFYENWGGVWSKYNGYDATFRTYGSYSLPSECGDQGTVWLEEDISGPAGAPDCYVNLYDLSVLAANWLDCTNPQDPDCFL